jgi:hypothetical protein
VSDPYASHTLSLILAWILACMIGLQTVCWICNCWTSAERAGISRVWLVWVGLCVLALSPARYMFFLVIAIASFPFQSGSAFLWTLGAVFRVWPFLLFCIALGIINLAGWGGPLILIILTTFAKVKEKPSRHRYIVSAVASPVICFVALALFPWFMAIGSCLIRCMGLPPGDMIRATNGPAYYAFCLVPSGVVVTPQYFADTPRTMQDAMRTHVATFYMSDKDKPGFIQTAYPDAWASTDAPDDH